jgi:hypothetical protein
MSPGPAGSRLYQYPERIRTEAGCRHRHRRMDHQRPGEFSMKKSKGGKPAAKSAKRASAHPAKKASGELSTEELGKVSGGGAPGGHHTNLVPAV